MTIGVILAAEKVVKRSLVFGLLLGGMMACLMVVLLMLVEYWETLPE